MEPLQIVVIVMYVVVVALIVFVVRSLPVRQERSADEVRMSELVACAKRANPGLQAVDALEILYNYKGEVLGRLDKDDRGSAALRQQLIKDRILIGAEMARLSREKIEVESEMKIPTFEP